MSTNQRHADTINEYWRKRGYNPQAEVRPTTVRSTADEMMAVMKDGKPVRDEKGQLVKKLVKDVVRISTLVTVVSNMIDANPTKKLNE